MKTKLIFLILALSLFAISCDNSEEKRRQQEEEQQRIEEEERKKLIDAVTKDLKSKEWVCKYNENMRERVYTLTFTNTMVKHKYEYKNIETGNIITINEDGLYNINPTSLTINITIDNKSYALQYSVNMLSGFWGSNYREFISK